MGPSKPLSSLFVSLFGVLWIAEKSSRKTVDGKTARGLYPAPHANGAALMAGPAMRAGVVDLAALTQSGALTAHVVSAFDTGCMLTGGLYPELADAPVM